MGSKVVEVCVALMLCRSIRGAVDTGYPAGLLAHCPGMNRSTLLSEETERSLKVVLIYPSPGFLGYEEKWCKLVDHGACATKHLNFKRKTMVIINGYLAASFLPIDRSFMAHYLSKKYNVIVLENFPVLIRSYPLAARIAKPLGLLLGEFLASFTRRGLPPSRLQLIGASLGAHIASFAAVTYRELTGYKPARITGLDPAGPCFRNVGPTEKLHPGVAHRVDVLHTNIDGFGIAEPLGDIDFYANGGEYQPKIKKDFIMPCFQLCSHVRALLYWLIAGTNPKEFVAIRCDSVANARHGACFQGKIHTNVLGPKTDFNKTGIFYLPTDAVPPYYLGIRGLKKRNFDVNNYLMTAAPDEDMTL